MMITFLIGTFLLHHSFSACIPRDVSDTNAADVPSMDALASGIRQSDTLSLKFTWPTYGGSGVRTIDTANTGFVLLGNADGALCSHTLAAAIIANNGNTQLGVSAAPCLDFTLQTEAWDALKTLCGSLYFRSSTTASTYDVNFIYRVTYTETISSGFNRTVNNDYAFVVSAPTSFVVSSNSYVTSQNTIVVTTFTTTGSAVLGTSFATTIGIVLMLMLVG